MRRCLIEEANEDFTDSRNGKALTRSVDDSFHDYVTHVLSWTCIFVRVLWGKQSVLWESNVDSLGKATLILNFHFSSL